MPVIDRLTLAAAGLFGAGGVAAAALAAHSDGGELMRTAALFLLIHAAALPGILAVSQRGMPGLRMGAVVLCLLVVGVVLFASDLIARARLGTGLFPMAAPAGGLAMLAGWVALALSGLATR